MKNNINLISMVIVLFFAPFFAEGKSDKGKSFIQEIKERITNEKEKVEGKSKEKEKEVVKAEVKVKEKNKGKDDYDYVHDNGRRNNKIIYRDYPYWIYDDVYYHEPSIIVTDVVYDDYVYIDDSDLISRRPIYEYSHPRRIPFLSSSVEAAYLGKDLRDTYGVTAKISANLYNLHFNCFYQNIFSSEEKLTIYSVNGGVSFALANLILTPFVGGFYIEPLEEAQFSYGADLQIFLPGNYNLDLYTINSSYGSLNFNNFSASLNREFYVLNAGLGFNYNNYAGVNFSGPFARLAFSF
jgi:hypothetical protein